MKATVAIYSDVSTIGEFQRNIPWLEQFLSSYGKQVRIIMERIDDGPSHSTPASPPTQNRTLSLPPGTLAELKRKYGR